MLRTLYYHQLRAPVYYCARCTSTMDIAHALGSQGAPHGSVVVASQQTAGRGQHGRTWHAAARRALLCSFLLRLSALNERQLQTLSLRAASAVCSMLCERYQINATIRWPNDILVGERKLCGILSERRGDRVVVGVGLNCTQRRFTDRHAAAAISLRMCRRQRDDNQCWPAISARVLVRPVVTALCGALTSSDWRDYINAHLWRRGRLVDVYPERGAPFVAYVRGVQTDGALFYYRAEETTGERGARSGRRYRAMPEVECLYAGSIRARRDSARSATTDDATTTAPT